MAEPLSPSELHSLLSGLDLAPQPGAGTTAYRLTSTPGEQFLFAPQLTPDLLDRSTRHAAAFLSRWQGSWPTGQQPRFELSPVGVTAVRLREFIDAHAGWMALEWSLSTETNGLMVAGWICLEPSLGQSWVEALMGAPPETPHRATSVTENSLREKSDREKADSQNSEIPATWSASGVELRLIHRLGLQLAATFQPDTRPSAARAGHTNRLVAPRAEIDSAPHTGGELTGESDSQLRVRRLSNPTDWIAQSFWGLTTELVSWSFSCLSPGPTPHVSIAVPLNSAILLNGPVPQDRMSPVPLRDHGASASEPGTVTHADAPAAPVAERALRLQAILGTVPISSSDLRQLQPGDILLTTQSDMSRCQVSIDGQLRFSARVGNHEGHRAIQLLPSNSDSQIP